MTALSARQYVASNPAGFGQVSSEIYRGYPANPHDNADPSVSAWQPAPPSGLIRPMMPDAASGDMSLSSHAKIQGASAIP
jgi:hypothetical protein